MKIAIASNEKNEEGNVSEISGRAPYYLIYENGELVKTIKNPFLMGGGAGPAVVQMLYNEKVEMIISQKFGEKMKAAMDAKKIKYKEINKPIKEIIKISLKDETKKK